MDFNKSLCYEDVSLQIMSQDDFDEMLEITKDPEIYGHNIMINHGVS